MLVHVGFAISASAKEGLRPARSSGRSPRWRNEGEQEEKTSRYPLFWIWRLGEGVNPGLVAFLFNVIIEDDPLFSGHNSCRDVEARTRCSCGYEGTSGLSAPVRETS